MNIMEPIINKFAMEVEREITNTIRLLSKRYNLDEREAYRYIMETNKGEGGGKRGRPTKERTEEESSKVKGPRGRPPKEEKKITTHVGEDLITRLLAKAKEEELK